MHRELHTQLSVALVAALLFTVESWLLTCDIPDGGAPNHSHASRPASRPQTVFACWFPPSGGVDRFAFWGNADPLNLEAAFLTLFPVWLANGLHRFTQYFIAVFFATRVGREQLGLGSWHALVGGIFYACFSYFTFGEMLALPALPMSSGHKHAGFERYAGGSPCVLAFLFYFYTYVHAPRFHISLCSPRCGAFWFFASILKAAINLGLLVTGVTIGDLPEFLAAVANAPFSHRQALPAEALSFSLDGLDRQLRSHYLNQDPLGEQYEN